MGLIGPMEVSAEAEVGNSGLVIQNKQASVLELISQALDV